MDLPWRDRVEVFAIDPVRAWVLGGIYDDDGSFGVFGGGVEGVETILAAARREVLEESGHTMGSVELLPIPPLEHLWKAPYMTADQARRSANYCGSRTHFVWGWLDAGKRRPPAEPSGLHQICLYHPMEALRIQARLLKSYPHPERLVRRIAALTWLLCHVKWPQPFDYLNDMNEH